MHFGAHILSGMLRASVICRLAVKEKYFVITTCRTAHDFEQLMTQIMKAPISYRGFSRV